MSAHRAVLRSARAASIGLMLIAALASVAQAQQAPEPAPQPPAAPAPAPPAAETSKSREGLLAGLSLGFGTIAASNESDGTLTYQLQFGGFLSNQWALAVELWGGQHNDSGYNISNSNAGVSLQYWVGKTLWCKGSVGTASLEASFDDVLLAEHKGAAIAGGIGWDFYQRAQYHFSVSFGLTVEGYENTRDNVTATALQVGVQYY